MLQTENCRRQSSFSVPIEVRWQVLGVSGTVSAKGESGNNFLADICATTRQLWSLQEAQLRKIGKLVWKQEIEQGGIVEASG
jgi:hypothetical protein